MLDDLKSAHCLIENLWPLTDLYTKHSKACIFLLVQNGSEEWQVTWWAKLSQCWASEEWSMFQGGSEEWPGSQGGSEEWPTSYKVDLKSG